MGKPTRVLGSAGSHALCPMATVAMDRAGGSAGSGAHRRPARRSVKAPLWLVSTVGLAVSTVLLGLWVTRPILWPPNGEALALAPGRRLDPIEAEQGHASVLLVGDTHFGESYHLTQAAHRLEADRYDYPLSKLRPLLNSASLTVANLETPLVAERSAVSTSWWNMPANPA